MSSDSRVRNRISPIQMNSGSAVSDHDEDERQIVVIIASPTGRDGEQLHADEGDAQQRQADPDAGAEQQEQDEEKDRDAAQIPAP